MPTKRRNNKSGGSRRVQNVRLIDRDEPLDSLKVSSILNHMTSSNSQTRIVCGYAGSFSPQAPGGGTVSLSELQSTDDWVTMVQQFREFRIRAIQFRIFDVQPGSVNNVNFWATYHSIGGVVSTEANDVVDRPDARSIAPGTGYTELSWVAHGQPEMEYQSTTSSTPFGGLVYYNNPASAIGGNKYSVVAKFVVDFRARY